MVAYLWINCAGAINYASLGARDDALAWEDVLLVSVRTPTHI